VRSNNCLRDANIKTMVELVEKTEPEILAYRNFGKKSLNEVVALLKTMGLSLGVKVDRNKLNML